MKKTSLTPEERHLMIQVRNEWIGRCDSGAQINQLEAAKCINWLYSSAKLKEPKKIVYVSSPLGAQYAFNVLSNNIWDNTVDDIWDDVLCRVGGKVWYDVGPNVWDNLWDHVNDSLWPNVWSTTRTNVRVSVWDTVRTGVRDNVDGKVWDKVKVEIRDNVNGKVWDNVGTNILSNVRENISAKKLEYTGFSNYGSINDYGWVAFYDFFTRIGIINHDGFNKFVKLLKTNIYSIIQLDRVCIVCELPEFVNRDKKGQLHSTNGPAIKWRDGYELFYLYGTPFAKDKI